MSCGVPGARSAGSRPSRLPASLWPLQERFNGDPVIVERGECAAAMDESRARRRQGLCAQLEELLTQSHVFTSRRRWSRFSAATCCTASAASKREGKPRTSAGLPQSPYVSVDQLAADADVFDLDRRRAVVEHDEHVVVGRHPRPRTAAGTTGSRDVADAAAELAARVARLRERVAAE